MAIRFLCPNGHGLSSSEQKAGAYGKCPNCDVMFQVPFAESAAQGLRRAEEIISFACPAGHPIRVPVRMAGQVGKCPTCECSVRAPVPQTLPGTRPQTIPGNSGADFGELTAANAGDGEEIVEEGITLDPDDADSNVSAQPGDSEQSTHSSGGEPMSESPVPGSSVKENVGHYPHTPGGGGPPPLGSADSQAGFGPQPLPDLGAIASSAVVGEGVDSPHPMTLLFEALWDGTQRDAIVDVYYGESERISPQHYAHELSHGQHAVFAVLEQNETHTLYLIPWSRIHRVAVREITELPPGMFD